MKKSTVLTIIFALALSGLCTSSSNAATVYKPDTDMGSNAIVLNQLRCDDDTKGYYITSVKEYKPDKKLVNVVSGDFYDDPILAESLSGCGTGKLKNSSYTCYCGAWVEVIVANELEYLSNHYVLSANDHCYSYHELMGWAAGGNTSGSPTQSTQIYFKDTLYEQDGYKRVKK